MRLVRVLPGAVLLAAGAVSLSPSAGAQDSIKIGAPLAISGKFVAYGASAKRGVEMADVLRVLREGEIRRAAEWETQHSEWKYRVEGADLDGDELTAITVILTAEMRLLIVTVF